MKRVDILIASVLAVSAIASIAGALTYQDARVGAAFDVSWTTSTLALPEVQVTHTGAGDEAAVVPVEATNLTRVTFTVTVGTSTPRVQPTEILVEVRPPGGNGTVSQEATLPAGPGGSVALPFEFDLAAVPDVQSLAAASPDAAAQQLAALHASTNGTGEWSITVQLAPGAPGPLAGQEAHQIAIVGEATRYEAQVATSVPEVGR